MYNVVTKNNLEEKLASFLNQKIYFYMIGRDKTEPANWKDCIIYGNFKDFEIAEKQLVIFNIGEVVIPTILPYKNYQLYYDTIKIDTESQIAIRHKKMHDKECKDNFIYLELGLWEKQKAGERATEYMRSTTSEVLSKLDIKYSDLFPQIKLSEEQEKQIQKLCKYNPELKYDFSIKDHTISGATLISDILKILTPYNNWFFSKNEETGKVEELNCIDRLLK